MSNRDSGPHWPRPRSTQPTTSATHAPRPCRKSPKPRPGGAVPGPDNWRCQPTRASPSSRGRCKAATNTCLRCAEQQHVGLANRHEKEGFAFVCKLCLEVRPHHAVPLQRGAESDTGGRGAQTLREGGGYGGNSSPGEQTRHTGRVGRGGAGHGCAAGSCPRARFVPTAASPWGHRPRPVWPEYRSIVTSTNGWGGGKGRGGS